MCLGVIIGVVCTVALDVFRLADPNPQKSSSPEPDLNPDRRARLLDLELGTQRDFAWLLAGGVGGVLLTLSLVALSFELRLVPTRRELEAQSAELKACIAAYKPNETVKDTCVQKLDTPILPPS